MIDELARLQAYRAEIAPPRPDSVRAARAALQEAIERERTPRVRRRRPLLIRAALAGAVAAAILVAVALSGSGGPEAPATAAAAVLNRLAGVAASQPWAYPKAGQYMYTYSIEAYQKTDLDTGCSVVPPEHRQIWIAPDGSGMLRESFGRGAFTSAADRRICAAHHELSMADAHAASNSWFGRGGLSDGPVNEQRLPTDPAKLRRLLTERRIEGGPRGPAEDFVQIGDLLRETDASPQLRATLYRVAATIPGVRSLGPSRDHRGRLGIGLAYGTATLIFNPHTAALMGETYRNAHGRVVSWAVYLVSKVVDRIPYRRR